MIDKKTIVTVFGVVILLLSGYFLGYHFGGKCTCPGSCPCPGINQHASDR
ncbi:hypothetical protein [Desulforamulus ruminis]|nr:hypothetical protein [Desulforamulus ruminis]